MGMDNNDEPRTVSEQLAIITAGLRSDSPKEKVDALHDLMKMLDKGTINYVTASQTYAVAKGYPSDHFLVTK